jgi:hypothetical protein
MRARYDLWQTEREQAAVMPNGVRVLRRESPVVVRDGAQRVPGTRYYAMIWRPKATKPEANYLFRTRESREEYISGWIANYNLAQAEKAAHRAARTAKPESAQEVTVGTVFVNSWGWEQTNVDYYEVVAVRGKMVDLRPIASEEVAGSQGFMCATVKPVRGAFLDSQSSYEMRKPNGETKDVLRKRVLYRSDGEPYLSFEYGCGSLVKDDQTNYSSWYA